jgi:hypothetical protein
MHKFVASQKNAGRIRQYLAATWRICWKKHLPISRAGAYPISVFIACGLFLWQDFPVRSESGMAIGLLGTAAIVVAVRAEHLTYRSEKIGWICVAFLLFFVETRALRRDRAEQNAQAAFAGEVELNNFRAVGRGIEKSIRDSQEHFNRTLTGINGLLYETTGASSYMYFDVVLITPTADGIPIPGITSGNILVSTMPNFVGKYPLRDVKVDPFCPMGRMPSVQYGTVYPDIQLRSKQGIYLQFPPNLPEKEMECALIIEASNGTYIQQFQFSRAGGSWSWKSTLTRMGSKKPKRTFSGQAIRGNTGSHAGGSHNENR